MSGKGFGKTWVPYLDTGFHRYDGCKRIILNGYYIYNHRSIGF
jgi:hypothetical protein